MKCVRQEFRVYLEIYLLAVRKDLSNTVEYIFPRFQIDCFLIFLFLFFFSNFTEIIVVTFYFIKFTLIQI